VLPQRRNSRSADTEEQETEAKRSRALWLGPLDGALGGGPSGRLGPAVLRTPCTATGNQHPSLQRPSHMGWELNGVEKRINFTWDHPLHHLGLTYKLRPQNRADRLAGKLPVGQQFWLE
jgi:hypothetical protein